jgi:hypothetical protein
MKKKYLLASVMIALITGASYMLWNYRSTTQCWDVLAKTNKKPPHLKFVKCYRHVRQVELVTAEYVVTDDQSEVVEKYLVKHFQMPKLVYACCGYESPGYGGVRDKNDKGISVRMGGIHKKGDEHVSRLRKDNQFTVTASWYKSDP